MHDQQKDVIVLAHADEGGFHEREVAVEIERLQSLVSHDLLRSSLTANMWYGTKVNDFQGYPKDRADNLSLRSILDPECCPQHLVTAHDFIDASVERSDIQLLLEADREGFVIKWTPLRQLTDDPQPLLCAGQWSGIGASTSRLERCPCGGALL
jgi:hypothetical protein